MESIEQATKELPLRSSGSASKYAIWRWTVLALVVLSEIAFRWVLAPTFKLGWGARVCVCGALAIGAMVMAVLSARTFGHGQTARRSWLIIGTLGVVDTLLFSTYLLPGIAAGAPGTSPSAELAAKSGSVVLAGTALSMLSRFMLAYVLWSTARFYRKSGLKFQLRRRDYLIVVILIALAVISLAYSNSQMRVQLPRIVAHAPQLMPWFDLTEWARLVALTLCSIFGVVVWRYATEMGGGLVAKAWRSVLLYAAIYLLRFAYTGVIAHLTTIGPRTEALRTASIAAQWFLLLSEYMLFLGASYQHEACTSNVDVPLDLDALASGMESA